MTADESSAPIDSFGIALPPEWVRIPLGGDFEEFVQSQRKRLANEGGLSPTAQRQFEVVLRQLREDYRRADVSLAAVLFALIDADDTEPAIETDVVIDAGAIVDADGEPVLTVEADAQISEGDDLLSATCTISSISRASLGSDLPLTVNTLAAALTRIPEKDDGTEVANLEPPDIVDTEAGRAVKVVRLVTLPPAPVTRERLALFTQHFFVPFDEGQRAVVITFASPSTAYAQPLSALFDAMMSTFRMYGGDDPTDLSTNVPAEPAAAST